ncbi:LamB/YcsF family protein [Pedobacter steynii]|uniref:5-oxoprolinase subunit A n=1 Tax=Pedobacter steynii TaxID=430522 RepID=A0A1D7QJ39_9SPHI|nr:5-oxoprolinase subunit PxpA [Pedobacter steynii]AOM78684.1 lactam utilization protein LamB [Pedobacter steynii]
MLNHYSADLNCDMGESFGAFRIGNDEAILPFVSAANIACGFHAGDPTVMKKTVRLAMNRGVAIGAHPGLPDLQGFGRREMAISAEEAYDMVVYQIGALAAFVKAEGGRMQHVKPHGALYNMAAVNKGLATAIAEAVYRVDPGLILYGLSGSELILAGEALGLQVANEVFADRTYQQDGTLTSRRAANALITDHRLAIAQVIRMIKEGLVLSEQGTLVKIKADTVCIHGDGSSAAAFAKGIHAAFQEEGITLSLFNNKDFTANNSAE